MTTTVVKLSLAGHAPGSEAARIALRNAGIGVLEVESWQEAREALRAGEASLLLADGNALAALDPPAPGGAALPRETARALSHDLRTPLSAMAGWLHLMESGKLDEAGLRRAIERLRGNIDDQVRTIEKVLGASQEGPG
jgi:signal transduction histidine kinase